MKKVTIADADSYVSAGDVFRPLSGLLGTTDVAINYYELGSGDSFGYCYHRHHEQEEVFYIQSGTVTFETENGDVPVEAGEVVRFPPGEFQRGTNRGDKRVVALALGAPQEEGKTDLRRECSNCGERTEHEIKRPEEGTVVTYCRVCGAETGTFG